MSSSRKANYTPKRDQDTFEELSSKLTADLRAHVRFMVRFQVLNSQKRSRVWSNAMGYAQADYPVLSDDWKKMAEQIGRIGDITEMVGGILYFVTISRFICLGTSLADSTPHVPTGAIAAEAAGRDAVGVRGDCTQVRIGVRFRVP